VAIVFITLKPRISSSRRKIHATHDDIHLTADDILPLSQWIKKSDAKASDFLSMGYKKDIFGSFAYEFELLHKMKSLLTQG